MFDKISLFGGKDPIKKILDENETAADKKKPTPEIRDEPYVLQNEGSWPYAVKYEDHETISGKRVSMEASTEDSDGEMYAGQFVRDAMEMRRYKPKDKTWFGYTKHPKRGVEHVGVPHKPLFRHLGFFGTTGFGKSTVMKNMMFQWMCAGYGIAFVDPMGHDSEELLRMIPEHRMDDVVWVEPGVVERKKSVGFNFFDTYSEKGSPIHEKEVEEIESDFVNLLRSSASSWGATMDSVAHAVSKQLIKSEKPYNLVDMYMILQDEEERKKFTEEYGNDIENLYLDQQLKEKDQEDLEPLNRRLRKFAEKQITREVIGHDESNISVTEAVEEGKILLLNTSSIPDDEISQLVATALINRIWSTIRARSEVKKSERTPYFLCIDELHELDSNSEKEAGMDIPEMLAEARKYRMSLMLSTQFPSQLSSEIREAMYSNCDNLFTFNPGEQNLNDAKSLARGIGGLRAEDLMSLGPYQIIGRVTSGGSKSPPIHIHTYPPYPYRHSKQKAKQVKDNSINKYGAKRKGIGDTTEEFGVLRYFNNGENDNSVEINDEGDTLTPQQVLECVHSATIRSETYEFEDKEDWIHEDSLREEITKYVGDLDYGILDNIVEKTPQRHLERNVASDVYFRLTAEGESEAFEQDSGTVASGGKTAHRELLRDGHKEFTKLGYDVLIPEQEGKRQPDGIARPPIDPMEQSNSFEEAKQLKEELKEQLHPTAWETFGTNEIFLEAESTTIQRPKQTIKNLVKAVENGNKCAFLVKDGTPKKGEFEYWARAGENILSGKDGRAEFVNKMDDDGRRKFYGTQERLTLADGSRALQEKSSGRTYWKEATQNGSEIVLETTDGQTLAQFKSYDSLNNAGRSEVPYNYYRETESGKTRLRDSEDNIVAEYNNIKELKEDGFRPIYKPLIPEEIFPDGKYPSKDTWTFVILPSDTSRKTSLYKNGSVTPLFEETTQTEQSNDESDEQEGQPDEKQNQQANESAVTYEEEADDNTVSLEELGFVDDREPEEVASKVTKHAPDTEQSEEGPSHLSEVSSKDQTKTEAQEKNEKENQKENQKEDEEPIDKKYKYTSL